MRTGSSDWAARLPLVFDRVADEAYGQFLTVLLRISLTAMGTNRSRRLASRSDLNKVLCLVSGLPTWLACTS